MEADKQAIMKWAWMLLGTKGVWAGWTWLSKSCWVTWVGYYDQEMIRYCYMYGRTSIWELIIIWQRRHHEYTHEALHGIGWSLRRFHNPLLLLSPFFLTALASLIPELCYFSWSTICISHVLVLNFTVFRVWVRSTRRHVGGKVKMGFALSVIWPHIVYPE